MYTTTLVMFPLCPIFCFPMHLCALLSGCVINLYQEDILQAVLSFISFYTAFDTYIDNVCSIIHLTLSAFSHVVQMLRLIACLFWLTDHGHKLHFIAPHCHKCNSWFQSHSTQHNMWCTWGNFCRGSNRCSPPFVLAWDFRTLLKLSIDLQRARGGEKLSLLPCVPNMSCYKHRGCRIKTVHHFNTI